MANYNIISDISEAIIKILKEGTVPDLIPNGESIGMCHPSDRGDIVLGVNLYDIKRNMDIVPTDKISIGTGKQRNPSTYIDLYYMITAYSSSDIKFRSFEEAKLIGRVIQLMAGRTVLKGDILSAAASMRFPPRIEFQDYENDEKMRLWNVPEVPYKLSLFYKVYPVEIESLTVSDVTRVVEADFTATEIKRED